MARQTDPVGRADRGHPGVSRHAARIGNQKDNSSRREFLTLAGGAAMLAVTLRPADATPATLAAAIRNVVGTAPVKAGKVKLDIPPLVENGNSVPMTVSVASPMTANEYVKSIHVFNEKNPQPNIGNFTIGPSAGRAQISTRIRLADSQKVVAIARLSDDSFWSASAD